MKWKVVPRPGSLSSQIRPPISSTSFRLIARPRPVPPNFRVVEPSACVNDSKIEPLLVRGDADPRVAAPRTAEDRPRPAAGVAADPARRPRRPA